MSYSCLEQGFVPLKLKKVRSDLVTLLGFSSVQWTSGPGLRHHSDMHTSKIHKYFRKRLK